MTAQSDQFFTSFNKNTKQVGSNGCVDEIKMKLLGDQLNCDTVAKKQHPRAEK
jgi:hypothetical protein